MYKNSSTLLNATLLLEYILMHARPDEVVRLCDAHVAQQNRRYIGCDALVVEFQGGACGGGWYIVMVDSEEEMKEIRWRGNGMEKVEF
jgi:hypothetical protein